MAKDRKYGPNVGLRLPLGVYDLLRERAEAAEQPVSVYARGLVLEGMGVSGKRERSGADPGKGRGNRADEPVQEYPDPTVERRMADAKAVDDRRTGERTDTAPNREAVESIEALDRGYDGVHADDSEPPVRESDPDDRPTATRAPSQATSGSRPAPDVAQPSPREADRPATDANPVMRRKQDIAARVAAAQRDD